MANPKPPTDGAVRFLMESGFKVQRMGGNTSAWVNADSDTLGVEIIISDGDYHAPEAWSERASVQVDLLDRRGEPITSYAHEFDNVAAFRQWYDSREGAFFALRTNDAEFTEEHLVAVGFAGID